MLKRQQRRFLEIERDANIMSLHGGRKRASERAAFSYFKLSEEVLGQPSRELNKCSNHRALCLVSIVEG